MRLTINLIGFVEKVTIKNVPWAFCEIERDLLYAMERRRKLQNQFQAKLKRHAYLLGWHTFLSTFLLPGTRF